MCHTVSLPSSQSYRVGSSFLTGLQVLTKITKINKHLITKINKNKQAVAVLYL